MSDVDPHAPIETDPLESDPNTAGGEGLAGGMGVSSERVGPTGSGEQRTHGLRDTTPADHTSSDPSDVPPEQRPGLPEPQPEGLEPKNTRD